MGVGVAGPRIEDMRPDPTTALDEVSPGFVLSAGPLILKLARY
jgi:hypothetical protein